MGKLHSKSVLAKLIPVAISVLMFHVASAGAQDHHASKLSYLNQLLAIDRLDFYSDGLADHLMDHNQKEIAEAIRRLEPEDYVKERFADVDLNNIDRWNELILTTLHKKYPSFQNVTLKDIEWNYNFFRKKLMEGFRAETVKPKKALVADGLTKEPVTFVKRSIPNIDAASVLLDTSRYIAEKTTRALFWDAALTEKSIEFHLGTERDFRNRISQEDREIVAEVKTRSANYNKIYLVFDPKSGEYSYAFTRISGDDRIKHLIFQLRLIKFQNKVALKNESVRVYGNATNLHQSQEKKLTELFKTLPKADMIVIGQKSAISNVINIAGMMAQVQPDIGKKMGEEKSQIQKLSQKVLESGSYFSVTSKASIVKSEFLKISTSSSGNYEILNSEQPSHDISDVLLETTDGRIVRWRFVSNMWGDEVVPLAKAIKNSGHEKVVYIGTAGALIEKGLKVGDVVAPAKTYTQKGKLLEIERPQYGADFVQKGLTLGQVTSPFDETKIWFENWKSKIDLVELETGYLRENLGSSISFQPYLLISDVVGSDHETLAVAAADSGKRKNGQLKLLESLFIVNKIKSPISSYEWISIRTEFKKMYHKIDTLRPSRDVVSKVQLTQIALRQGFKTDAELEQLVKAEPSFNRQLLIDKLEQFSSALNFIAKKIPNASFAVVGGEEFFNGTWNPKKTLNLKISVGSMEAAKAAEMFAGELATIHKTFSSELSIEFVNRDATNISNGVVFNSQNKNALVQFYEERILKKLGLNREVDKNGGVRYREIPESSGGNRCESLFL